MLEKIVDTKKEEHIVGFKYKNYIVTVDKKILKKQGGNFVEVSQKNTDEDFKFLKEVLKTPKTDVEVF